MVIVANMGTVVPSVQEIMVILPDTQITINLDLQSYFDLIFDVYDT